MIRVPRLSLHSLLVAAVLAGCGPQIDAPAPSQPSASAPADKQAELADRVEYLSAEIGDLRDRVDALESGAATVTTDGNGYDVARTRFGAFTVSTRGATPYLDGYKVRLRIGNLTTANFTGATLKLEWGPPYNSMRASERRKNMKKKDVNIPNRLTSGSFTEVDVILTPAKPEEIKTFTVGLELNQLGLPVR